MSAAVSRAVVDYIWRTDAVIPGHHPDNVADPVLRANAADVVAEVARIRPGADAADLLAWAAREARAIAARHPELDERAEKALRDLISWSWR